MFSPLFNEKKVSDNKLNLLLLSGSKAVDSQNPGTKPGFLDFAETWIKDFFFDAVEDERSVLFVPYARPSGISEEEYFELVKTRFNAMGINLVCAPATGITKELLQTVGGIFIGGGHTYTLLDKLQKTGSLAPIQDAVMQGLPYMGSSAGTIIACPTIKTTNDMPGMSADIMDFRSLGLIGTQLNCHYIDDSMHDPKHQGETRDTRIKEFCAFNPDVPVLGLYEGTALRVIGERTLILSSDKARHTRPPIFKNNERTEIECEVGVAKNITTIVQSHKVESGVDLRAQLVASQ